MASALSISEVNEPRSGSGISGIELLNFKDTETVNHPLLLLEGFCSRSNCCDTNQNGKQQQLQSSRNINSLLDSSCNTQESNERKELELLANVQTAAHYCQARDHVLIENNRQCTSWPVVAGGFKALVTLCTGFNRVLINACINGEWEQRELHVNYKPLDIPRYVRIVYIKCSDSNGTFQAPPGHQNDIDAARKKLAFNARLLQTFTAHNLHQHDLGYHTFRLEENNEGQPLVHVYTSTLTTEDALKMTGGQLYDRFHTELRASSLYDPECKLWTFMSCTQYDPPPPEEFNDRDIPTYVKGHTALGGGGLALFGTGGLHTWASSVDEVVSCFTNTTMIDKRVLFDDSSKRGTYWANYATCLGASMHELGHCFDLAHTPKGIMGRGFDDMNCVFTLCLWKKPPQPDDEEKGELANVDTGLPSTKISTEVDQNIVDETLSSGACYSNHDSFSDERRVKRLKVEPTTENTLCSALTEQSSMMPQEIQGKGGLTGLPGNETSNADTKLKPRKDDSRDDTRKDDSIDDTRVSSNRSEIVRAGDWSHGANWYRSSAVVLRYHKWFSSTSQSDDGTSSHPMVHWGRSVCGPVGNFCGFAQPNQTSFNDSRWLANQGLELGGYVIHADEYVNCIQTIGRRRDNCDDGERSEDQFSKPQGRDGAGQRYVFPLSASDERLTGVDARAGGWVDAIRLHTNVKSSGWMGGPGGDLYELRPSDGRCMTGLFGTAGKYVGSLGILLQPLESTSDVESDCDLIADAPHGIRLIELHNKIHGEVYKHWEFLDDPPPLSYPLPRAQIMEEQANIQIVDDQGNICRTGHMYDYTDVLINTTRNS